MKKNNNKVFYLVIITALLLIFCNPANAQAKKDTAAPKPKTYILTEGQAILVSQLLGLHRVVLPKSKEISAAEMSEALFLSDSIQKVLYRQSIDTLPSKPKNK